MTSTPNTYRYISLTAAIEDKTSPLRRYLDATFPNIATVRDAYQHPARPLLVPGGPANPGTLGAAFDFTVRFTLDPAHTAPVARFGYLDSPDRLHVLNDVVRIAQANADCRTSDAPELLLRACWALALTTEVTRFSGLIPPGSPLTTIDTDAHFTPDNLLTLAPEAALAEMHTLHAVARDHLYPHLPPPGTPTAIGPTFAASHHCPADADLIADGMLLELKTRQGPKHRTTGIRADKLTLTDTYQLLGYTLFDHNNEYEITRVGFYSARYGNLTTWPVQQFLDHLADRPVNLAAEREHVWHVLTDTQTNT